MTTPNDLQSHYSRMLQCRLFEEAVSTLWQDGLISGEIHPGTGEEAVNAGVMAHVRDGDALALDHRGTAPLLLRGVDPVRILRELLGASDGLCGGRGGHMHLFSRAHLAASTGIVGAGGPSSVGFALAGRILRPGSIAVGFFGEGSLNQGMMMESLNLASVWHLPVLFVCKDDNWSITTQSDGMTAGSIVDRVRGFGMTCVDVDGRDVVAVAETAGEAVERVRRGEGPAFLHARCVHLEGHFLGYQLTRITKNPFREMPAVAVPLTRSLLRTRGGSAGERMHGVRSVLGSLMATFRDAREDSDNDPVRRLRKSLDTADAFRMEDDLIAETAEIVRRALEGSPS